MSTNATRRAKFMHETKEKFYLFFIGPWKTGNAENCNFKLLLGELLRR